MPDDPATGIAVARQNSEPRDRIDLRADPEWVARLRHQAARFGLNISAYIREAVTQRIERDEQGEAEHARPRRQPRS